MAFDTILFDLDGTLTDPGIGITNSIAYALEQRGMPVPPRERLYRFIGPPLLDEFQKVYGVSEAEARELVAQFRVYFQSRGIYENRMYDGIPEMLQRLLNHGCRLVLATSKPEVFAEQVLEHFSLRKYFTAVAGSTIEEGRTDKAEVIAYALDKLEETGRPLMVGDRKHDVMGAQTNGIPCLGVLYGYGSREELTEAGADRLAAEVPDVADLILSPEF